MNDQYWSTTGLSSIYVRAAVRTLQFLFAIVIAIVYGLDLTYATSTTTRAQSPWVFAEVVAALSAITCTLHCFATVKRVLWCLWDWVLVVLWAAQTGVFGTMFISKNENKVEFLEATTSVPRMRAAVWVSLVNMLLWVASTILGMVWCCSMRRVTRRTDVKNVEGDKRYPKSLETTTTRGSSIGSKLEMETEDGSLATEKKGQAEVV